MASDSDACDLLCLDLANAEAARGRLPGAEVLDVWAAGAKALSHPTRLAVAVALAGSGVACVCER